MPTALIVEDEPEANKLLGMLLRLRGYRTESAFTGKEALQIVEKRQPDIIFLDLMLPDLNGYEICKILKSSRGTSLIPLVIVTARIAAENRIESFCLGADDYIAKPYTPDQIFQALEQAAQLARAEPFGPDPGEHLLRPPRRWRDPPPPGAASQPDLRPHRTGPGSRRPDQPGNQGNLVSGRRVGSLLPGRSDHNSDVHIHGPATTPGIPRRPPAGWAGF